MSDRIDIKGLRASCIIGVEAAERMAPQAVEIDLSLEFNLSVAGTSDSIKDTVDYKSLTDEVVVAVETSRYLLIEAVTQRIAEVCLEHALVDAVEVELRKPGALPRADWAGVTIRRSRRED